MYTRDRMHNSAISDIDIANLSGVSSLEVAALMFKGYIPNVRFRSTLLVNPQALHSSTIPPTEDLIALQDELQDIRSRAVERIRKSNSDLVLFKGKWDRSKEREKNRDALARERTKNKVKDSLYNKIKREPSETPSVDEAPLIARGGSTIHRKGDERNKIKRKRDERRERDRTVDEVDSELLDPLIERPPKKAKLNNHVSQLTIPPPAPEPPIDPEVATDFTLPPSFLSNVRPVLGLWGEDNLLRSMPSTPLEVREDFTNVKPPGAQAQISPFWKEVDGWLRPVGEEDVAWVRYATDDTELFRVPKLGRHYSEIWEEETVPPEPLPSTTTEPLSESDLNMQKKGLGPLTERVISALLSVPGQPPPKKGDDDSPAPNASVTTTQLAPVSFHDMETRLKLELRACGLLGTEEPNFAESYDDDIASEIRRLQADLRSVKRVNDARKERLTTVANDRLAYQDYLEMLDDLNKQIGSGYQRIFRANHKASAGKKKKGPGQKEGGDAVSEASRAKTLVMDVPESLVKVMEVRKQFKEVFGTAMLEWETRFPGRIMGLPRTSIYEGLKLGLEGAEWDDDVIQTVDIVPRP